MRYFSDEKLAEMKKRIDTDIDETSRAIYYTYLKRIEELDRLNDTDSSHSAELLKAISEFQHFSDVYVPHSGRVDINDEDADAFEYENYDFQPSEL